MVSGYLVVAVAIPGGVGVFGLLVVSWFVYDSRVGLFFGLRAVLLRGFVVGGSLVNLCCGLLPDVVGISEFVDFG